MLVQGGEDVPFGRLSGGSRCRQTVDVRPQDD